MSNKNLKTIYRLSGPYLLDKYISEKEILDWYISKDDRYIGVLKQNRFCKKSVIFRGLNVDESIRSDKRYIYDYLVRKYGTNLQVWWIIWS